MNYEQLCKSTITVAREAGSFIATEYQRFDESSIRFKDTNDLVSYVDIESENMIKESLLKLLPGSCFIAEETAFSKGYEQCRYKWIIDPLDGTTNFVHKLPLFCVSIALMEEQELKLGVIYEVMHNECFYAWEGGKAYLDGKEIQVTRTKDLMNSLLATGFPFKDFHLLDLYIDFLKYLMKHSRGVRRLGSAAADLAYVACGRFDAFYEYNLSPWDVAAGAFIVKQAGGKVTDFSGGNNFLFGKEIIASNPAIIDELIDKLSLWKKGTPLI
jgi:myo-inositol-1(or 4)-monophosphatase